MAEEEPKNSTTNNVRVMTYNEDPLYLQSSDHQGAGLVTSPLTSLNYLSWSRSVRITLGAKTKLGFVDGTCERPAANSPNLEQWRKVDWMATSWLLNSFSKDIVEAFSYLNSARDLLIELEQRFGESNGPLLHQL